MSTRQVFCAILSLSMYFWASVPCSQKAKSVPTDAEMTQSQQALEEDDLKELNNQIRREKFDLILPQVMRKNNIDMWIHVMRESRPDRLWCRRLWQYLWCFHLHGSW